MAIFKKLADEHQEMVFRLTTGPTPHEETLGIERGEHTLTAHWRCASNNWHPMSEDDLDAELYEATSFTTMQKTPALRDEFLTLVQDALRRHLYPTPPRTEQEPA